ncbi:hypothetical protein ACFFX0_04425 [Citricoccus parietis]|uniref:Uncharacterized protein n=1 Tax=Citricoccus parietis TaxID=592307 RepID=A0ABV5FUW1_9MICC
MGVQVPLRAHRTPTSGRTGTGLVTTSPVFVIVGRVSGNMPPTTRPQSPQRSPVVLQDLGDEPRSDSGRTQGGVHGEHSNGARRGP